MANITKTYSRTDWEIWTYVPVAGSFVLDFSKLNGSDVLGSTDGSMQISTDKIASIQVQEGGPVNNGIFTEAIPARLLVTLNVFGFTSALASKYLVGTAIWLTYKNAETYGDPVMGTKTPMFIGKIRSFNVDVQPGEDMATISIEATSNTEDDLNTLVTMYRNDSVLKDSLLASSAAAYGIPTNFYSETGPGLYLHYPPAIGVNETKSYGEWVAEFVTSYVNIVRDDVTPALNNWTSTTRSWYFNQGIKTTASFAGQTARSNIDSTKIIAMQMDWDGAGAPTGVNLTNYYTPALTYQIGNSQGSSTGGASIYTQTVDVKDSTEMVAVANRMLSSTRTFAPVMIAVKIAINNQSITFLEDTLLDYGGTPRSVWIYPQNLLRIGETFSITISKYSISSYSALVVGRTINVTPDDYTVQYNLWKGL
jgi:hypothetical protein